MRHPPQKKPKTTPSDNIYKEGETYLRERPKGKGIGKKVNLKALQQANGKIKRWGCNKKEKKVTKTETHKKKGLLSRRKEETSGKEKTRS